ncbi:MAG: hypothetical protein H6797_05390 [Candidatus Nomurabacteria bacterium]|nr:MAG: hypothetical protein H6797_05390 [Candidatus Nomurabacteria bacterium]
MVAVNDFGPIIPSQLRTRGDWHRFFVLNDEGFINDVYSKVRRVNGKKNLSDEDATTIGSAYAINVLDIHNYVARGSRGQWVPPSDYFTVQQSPDSPDKWVVVFDKSAMQQDFLNAYEQFDWFRSKQHPLDFMRRRAPEQPALIYSIFTQRRQGKHWGEIFKMYQNGTLPGYEGSASQYTHQKSLEAHYNRYRPTP